MQIYLDYSATAPPRQEAIAAVRDAMERCWGNPSSLHQWGERAALSLERARLQVARLIGAEPESIVFTSGGTEANHLALQGVARQYLQPQHVVISQVEHPASDEPARRLQSLGWQVTRLPVDCKGRICPDDLQDALQSNTVLVSVIYGQSEIGTLQPIAELGAIARSRGVLFHTDAVQAVGRLPVDVQKLPVDLLSLSSHKIYGPLGAGALYVRPGTELVPLQSGGGQERGLRAGTQTVPIVAGFGVAAELQRVEMAAEIPRLTALRDRLFQALEDIPGLIPTGDRQHRLPHHASFCISDPETYGTGRDIVRQMNLAGIGISSGSACHSGKLAPSSVLLACGYSEARAEGGIRLTLGRHTTFEDVEWATMALRQILQRRNPRFFSVASNPP